MKASVPAQPKTHFDQNSKKKGKNIFKDESDSSSSSSSEEEKAPYFKSNRKETHKGLSKTTKTEISDLIEIV